MKVLAISHSYVEPYSRVGLLEHKDIDLTCVIPRFVAKKEPEGYERLIKEGYKVKTISTIFNFHHSVRVYSIDLFLLIARLKPDIILVHNEPWSSTSFQITLFCSLFYPKIKILIHTSENQVRRYPFPFCWSERFSLSKAQMVLTVTQKEGEVVLRRHKGYKGKIRYLPLSVNTDLFKPQNEEELKRSIAQNAKIVIGYIGRLVKEKGVDLLIKATKGIDSSLLIIGDGPERQNLEYLAKGHRVTFLSNIFHTELPRYINCLDILVLPSLTTKNWKEQFGRVLIEAMACEVAVIGSDSGEIPQVIGDAGLVFKEGDVNDLFLKLAMLIKDKNLQIELAKRGRERVMESFSWKKVEEETYKIYQEILREEI
jgi:glycosyltransferase involved in cell wall biosynthesis